MSDLISRQAAMKRITAIDISIIPYAKAREYVEELKSYVIKTIEDIPSAEPERKWIPVTEALPEEGRYLVTRYDYVTKSSFIDICWFEKNMWWNRQITGNFSVLAWMPLPEPWRGEYEN